MRCIPCNFYTHILRAVELLRTPQPSKRECLRRCDP